MSLGPDEEYCRSCGNTVKKAAVRCPSCGVNTNDSGVTNTSVEVYCESCGEAVKPNAEICPNCGVSQNTSKVSELDFELDSEALYYVQIALGGLLLLAALGSIVDLSDGIIASVSGAVGYGIVGLLLLPQVRERLEKRHPVTTFGWTKSVRTVSLSNHPEPCAICLGTVDEGVQRTYGKEFVVAGVTLWFDVDGVNQYCIDCLEDERSMDLTDQATVDATERQ